MESTTTLLDCPSMRNEEMTGSVVRLDEFEPASGPSETCQTACPHRRACYQTVSEWYVRQGQYQRPDVTVSDRLAIAHWFYADDREWGAVKRMAIEHELSRKSIYDIADRASCLFKPRRPGPVPCLKRILPCGGSDSPRVEVVEGLSREEQERARGRLMLTAVFPGGVTMRPLEDLLEEVPGVPGRSAPTICRFVNAAGSQAQEILSQVDYAGVRLPVILVEVDETFFNRRTTLFVVEPMSLSIVGQYVPPDGDRSSETWGPVLLTLKEDQHLDFFGGVGDGAKAYPLTFKLVLGREDAFQEDVFHPKRDMYTLQCKLKNSAYRAFGVEYKLAEQCNSTPDMQDKLRQAKLESERQATVHDAYVEAMAWAEEAFEIVDLHSGEIRDRTTNAWWLNEAIRQMSKLDQPDVSKMHKRLAKHQPYLFQCLDWLATRLAPLRADLTAYLHDPALEQVVWQAAARCWRLQHEVHSNQRTAFRCALKRAQDDLAVWIAGDAVLEHWCAQVHTLLECVQRASSAVENVNGIFKPLVKAKKHFSNDDTYANFVALFTLWHNLRVFKEGKRQGFSPFEILGIDLGEKDWRTLLGYPPCAH